VVHQAVSTKKKYQIIVITMDVPTRQVPAKGNSVGGNKKQEKTKRGKVGSGGDRGSQ